MRIAEKTLELTLCCQLGWLVHRWHGPWPDLHGPQPLWFGLTQAQEARAGFDAATRLRNGRMLMLQFKAGKRMSKSGFIRFTAPHRQLTALQHRLNSQRRLIYYVLPAVTRTRDLHSLFWLLEQTWFLDVGDIPALGVPGRQSQDHHITLDPNSGDVVITSDPVNVKAINGLELLVSGGHSPDRIGGKYEDFRKFWSYARLLGGRAIGAALPE